MSQNLPPLRDFVDAGLKVVLLKGAARIALNPVEQKSRTAFDLDLLLPDGDFETAAEMLTAQDWQSSRGESALGLKARISSVRARNFKKGRFGDIDLHRAAYQNIYANAHFDALMLQDARTAEYYGVPVFVPSVEERLVMAMGHGAWDGHHHSDWLVDIAAMLETEAINWDKLHKIATGRRLRGPSAIALSFLAQEMNLKIPHEVLRKFGADRPRARIRDIPDLIMARETDALNGSQKRLRKVVHGFYRLRRSGRNRTQDVKLVRTFTRSTALEIYSPEDVTVAAVQPDKARGGQWTLTAKLLVKAPAIRRRIELDVNGPNRNLCHVQVLHLRQKAGLQLVTFSVRLNLTDKDFPISVLSLPSKFIEAEPDSHEYRKYSRVSFKALSLKLDPGKT
ncbi:nucleotidyltransferase family protein [Phaeovulum sp.]|uniref:nucleotidyltransferase family protein n=1 Tax=Phaeovulum sp. TaxID=2934796 RepID=UPI0039E36A80